MKKFLYIFLLSTLILFPFKLYSDSSWDWSTTKNYNPCTEQDLVCEWVNWSKVKFRLYKKPWVSCSMWMYWHKCEPNPTEDENDSLDEHQVEDLATDDNSTDSIEEETPTTLYKSNDSKVIKIWEKIDLLISKKQKSENGFVNFLRNRILRNLDIYNELRLNEEIKKAKSIKNSIKSYVKVLKKELDK